MIILIVPIGAPGSGKTTLKRYLAKKLENFYTTERDEEFAKLRKDNSLKKTRKMLFDILEEFLQKIVSTNQENPKKTHYVYLDSSNSKIRCRENLYQKLLPDKIIEINFNLPRDILLERVRNRWHPTFPKTALEQENMLDIINANIEFSDSNDDRLTKIYVNEILNLEEIENLIL